MEKIIGTKRYNTETARLIGRAGGEEMYRKRGGEFFLASEGKITPMPFGPAKAWIEEHLDPAAASAVFAAPENQSATVTYRLSGEAIEMLQRLAAQQGTSMSAIVEDAIRAYDEEHNEQKVIMRLVRQCYHDADDHIRKEFRPDDYLMLDFRMTQEEKEAYYAFARGWMEDHGYPLDKLRSTACANEDDKAIVDELISNITQYAGWGIEQD